MRKVYDIVCENMASHPHHSCQGIEGEKSMISLFNRRLQNEAERQQNQRAAMKQNINKVCQENQGAGSLLK